jgi:uncharacterized protein (DUF924 family)
MNDPEEVLAFWFGPLDAQGKSDASHVARWWRKDPAFDAEVASRFGALHEAVAGGQRDHWLATPRGRLAFVIVLDQFSRNMFRGSARAFATDQRAQQVVLEGIAAGMDRTLSAQERGFFYMPLMHSERLDTQNRCVELFTDDQDAGYLKYAQQHRDIIQRFGRFPHRNALLDRPSTEEELAFLQLPGSSF